MKRDEERKWVKEKYGRFAMVTHVAFVSVFGVRPHSSTRTHTISEWLFVTCLRITYYPSFVRTETIYVWWKCSSIVVVFRSNNIIYDRNEMYIFVRETSEIAIDSEMNKERECCGHSTDQNCYASDVTVTIDPRKKSEENCFDNIFASFRWWPEWASLVGLKLHCSILWKLSWWLNSAVCCLWLNLTANWIYFLFIHSLKISDRALRPIR